MNLSGKNLYTYLDKVYRVKSKFCIMFISKEYIDQLYTQHERASIQARAFSENSGYNLPYRIDDTEIPGLLPTIAFLKLATTPPAALATIVIQKIALIKNEYSIEYLADRNTQFDDLLYNFSQDIGHLRWGHFKSDPYKKNAIELMFDPTEHFQLSADNHHITGTNLMDLPPAGTVEFSYSPTRLNHTADNLLIYIIPIISEKKAMPVELGFSKVDDPGNAHSSYRIKYVCKGEINAWINASIP